MQGQGCLAGEGSTGDVGINGSGPSAARLGGGHCPLGSRKPLSKVVDLAAGGLNRFKVDSCDTSDNGHSSMKGRPFFIVFPRFVIVCCDLQTHVCADNNLQHFRLPQRPGDGITHCLALRRSAPRPCDTLCFSDATAGWISAIPPSVCWFSALAILVSWKTSRYLTNGCITPWPSFLICRLPRQKLPLLYAGGTDISLSRDHQLRGSCYRYEASATSHRAETAPDTNRQRL